EIREIHLAVMGDTLDPEVREIGRKVVQELRQRRGRAELFARLAAITVTTVDSRNRVKTDTSELRRMIREIVWAYKGKEQTLLADFADHMFKYRKKYYEWR